MGANNKITGYWFFILDLFTYVSSQYWGYWEGLVLWQQTNILYRPMSFASVEDLIVIYPYMYPGAFNRIKHMGNHNLYWNSKWCSRWLTIYNYIVSNFLPYSLNYLSEFAYRDHKMSKHTMYFGTSLTISLKNYRRYLQHNTTHVTSLCGRTTTAHDRCASTCQIKELAKAGTIGALPTQYASR